MPGITQLKRIRTRLGLTQTEFAKQAGVSQSLITKIEAGKIDPKYSTVQRLEHCIAQLENKTQPTVGEIMQCSIIYATPQERITHLIRRMQQAGISQVPVMDGKHVAGLITESIILEAIEAGKELSKVAAAEIMIESPPILPASTPLPAAMRLLEHSPIILVSEKSNVVGIVARSDLIKATL
jgi:predicted transcriptional regulator